MSNGLSQRQLKSFLAELDSHARKVALMVCHAYKNPNEKRVYAEIRSEFHERKRRAQRAARALTKLSKGLRELNTSIKSSLKNDVRSWSDTIREVNIPKDSGALLPIYDHKLTLKEYLQVQDIQDHGEPFETLLQTQRQICRLASKEARTIQRWIRTTSPPPRRSFALFAKSGALHYALHRLFKTQTSGRLFAKNVEERIARILTLLDGGGPSVDLDRKDCAAVRQAIKRLPRRYKTWCDKFLAHRLISPRN